MSANRSHCLLSSCLVFAFTLAACSPTNVQVTRAPNGGWTMRTTADSLDQAMRRFNEEAPKLCPQLSYAMGEPVTARAGQSMAVAIALVCTGP